MVSSRTKHLLHCLLLAVIVISFEILAGGINFGEKPEEIDPWIVYGVPLTLLLYILRLLTFLALPQVLFNVLGLTLYNAFPEKITLKGSPLLAPFLCIRVVTRGDFPDLVKRNVIRNLNLCLDVGVESFIVEVVTDRPIPGLSEYSRVREVVIPPAYVTKSGALFKARALQYCLEDGVNIYSDSDWIVHLDEETILTENSVRGILNFVLDGKHQFGQGVITYANDQVVNWMTTLADSFRVADDMGKLRAQFYLFHKPYFSWKGSYVVTQVGAERKITFDNGPDGSVAEDCFFGMKAYAEGYTFNFIEGEMWEKSPFTIWDFLQQRKRWMQGIYLVVHSKAIHWEKKILLTISLYSWVTLPLSTSNIVLACLAPIPCTPLLDFLCAFIGAMNIYMYVFGVIKSFSLHRMGLSRLIIFILGALLTIPFNIIIENIAVVWGLFGNKYHFYVVNKEVKPPTTV
ncbi:unnamed protein product [Allacma fusca]|uniref:Glycosyltransferase 2-like domain-containing protein n=1 Tax=Allacma fusca TaxID=39272 RepID=A0A8J2LFD1_9HEXA|nr:unnamed protein product [Allacma fusca]